MGDEGEGEGGEEKEEGGEEGEAMAGGGPPRCQRPIPGGACFRRFVYAKRSKARRGMAAYAHLGEPWYSFVPLEALLNRAPFHPPFKVPQGADYLLYNDDMV